MNKYVFNIFEILDFFCLGIKLLNKEYVYI